MRLEELTDDAIDYIFENLDDTKFDKWQRGFVPSVRDQWERNRSLSDKQREALGRVWDSQE
jgi:hypothetical protein